MIVGSSNKRYKLSKVSKGGNTTLDTGSLTFTDIKDKDKGIDIGVSGSLSKTEVEDGSEYEGSVEGNYGALDREQTTRATIGDGKIIVGGKEEKPDINRDESKGQEVTKDVTVDTINAKYDSEAREWNEVPNILNEQVEVAVVEPLIILDESEKIDLSFLDEAPNIRTIADGDFEGTVVKEGDSIPEDYKIVLTGIKTNLESGIKTGKYQGEGGDGIILVQNDTHGLAGDLLESAIDKFGSDGVQSKVAKSTGEFLWTNRNNKNEIVAHSQGSLVTRKALEYIVNTYGDQALSQLNYSKITLTGPAANGKEFKKYAEAHGYITDKNEDKIVIKNNKNDPVGSIIGNNPVTTDSETGHTKYPSGQNTLDKNLKTPIQKIGNITKKILESLDFLKNGRKIPKKTGDGKDE